MTRSPKQDKDFYSVENTMKRVEKRQLDKIQYEKKIEGQTNMWMNFFFLVLIFISVLMNM